MSIFFVKEELLVNIQERLGQNFLSMSDLECPKSDFMMRYFTSVLSYIGIDVELLVDHKLLQSLPDAEHYKWVLQYTQVYNAVKMAFPIPELLKNFSLLSLMEPKPSDISYVAIFDNFCEFWASQMLSMRPHMVEVEQIKEKLKQLEQRKEDLEQRLNDRAAKQSKCQMELMKLEDNHSELEAELKDLQSQEQSLNSQLASIEPEVKELQEEMKINKLKVEKVEEQQKMEAEIENVSAELESLRLKQQEQNSILAEKRVAIVEKASRERFLDTILDHEERALQAFSEVLEEIKQIEIQEKNILECERKKQTVLRNAEAGIMTLKNRESKKVALESEISSQEKYMHSLEEEGENLLKEFDNIQCSLVQDEQKCKLLQNKCSNGEVRIKEQEDKIINLHSTFQRLHDKMYEKVEEDSKHFNDLLKGMMS